MAVKGVPFLALEALRGDPILCMCVNANGCCGGTAFGRVSAFLTDSQWHPTERRLVKKVVVEGGDVDTSNDSRGYAYNQNSQFSVAEQEDVIGLGSNSSVERSLNSSGLSFESKPRNSKLALKGNKSSGCFQLTLPHSKLKEFGNSFCSSRKRKTSKTQYRSDAFSGTYVVLAAFSDEPIKAIHMSSEQIVTVMNNCQYCTWNLSSLQNIQQPQRNRNLGSLARIIFSHNEKMLITTSSQSIIADISTGTQQHSSFHIADADTAVMDFNGSYVACLTKEIKSPSTVRIFETKPKHRREMTSQPLLVEIFEAKRPFFGDFVTLVSFWEPNRVVVVHDANKMSVFDYQLDKFLGFMKGTSHEIVAIDGSNPDTLVAMTKKPQLTVWDSKSYAIVAQYDCKPAKFDLGWRYLLGRYERTVAFTSDQGMYLMNV